jgi:hypothetical protein
MYKSISSVSPQWPILVRVNKTEQKRAKVSVWTRVCVPEFCDFMVVDRHYHRLYFLCFGFVRGWFESGETGDAPVHHDFASERNGCSRFTTAIRRDWGLFGRLV